VVGIVTKAVLFDLPGAELCMVEQAYQQTGRMVAQ
jgi:hypothetical protein